jgi:hypothetical protein
MPPRFFRGGILLSSSNPFPDKKRRMRLREWDWEREGVSGASKKFQKTYNTINLHDKPDISRALSVKNAFLYDFLNNSREITLQFLSETFIPYGVLVYHRSVKNANFFSRKINIS